MALVAVLALGAGAQTQPTTPLTQARNGTYVPLPSTPPGAQQVAVGFYPVAIYDLDQSSNTFYADTYVWLRWKGEVDPSATLEFTNMLQHARGSEKEVARAGKVIHKMAKEDGYALCRRAAPARAALRNILGCKEAARSRG